MDFLYAGACIAQLVCSGALTQTPKDLLSIPMLTEPVSTDYTTIHTVGDQSRKNFRVNQNNHRYGKMKKKHLK